MAGPATLNEDILEPDLPIVDPHHHLWDSTAETRALAPPSTHGFSTVTSLSPRYLLDELLADLKSGHNVRATVYLECRSMYRLDGPTHLRPVGETEFVNGVAAMTASGLYGPVRACAGIMGHANLALGDVIAETLEAHIAAAPARFRGVRQSSSWDADPDVLGPLNRGQPAELYRSAKFREGFSRLAPLGLSFDAWLLEPQLPDLIDLARFFPETSIVLDHVGTPLGVASYAGRRDERFGVWRDNIRELAKHANVKVKLGGLAMAFCNFDSFLCNPPAPSTQLAAEWKPYIETVIEAFGVDRCMFESNFPVDRGACSYATLWNAFKHIAAGYSADEKTALFSGSAIAAYRLEGMLP